VALPSILNAARWNNARLSITGVLGHIDMTYVQLLEGPPQSLDRLLATLFADPRHTEIEVMLRGRIATRLVPDWTMAGADLTSYAPKVEQLLQVDDALGLIGLLANLAHNGVTKGS
jgi:hypothetical protein